MLSNEESRKTVMSNNLFHLVGQTNQIEKSYDKEGTESFITANEEDKKEEKKEN